MPNCRICDSPDVRVKVSVELENGPADIAFCQECAHKFEMDMDALERKGLPEFFGRCMAFSGDRTQDESKGLSCPNCGLSADEILSERKAGCAFCYIVFRDLPIPKRNMANQQIDVMVAENCECKHESPEILERLLQEAIAEEDYESAALIRDQLRDAETADES